MSLMNIEEITLGAARVAKAATSIKGAYALAGDRDNGILPIISDVPDAPIIMVRHERFELEPGSFETIRHFLSLDLWVRSGDPESIEVQIARIVPDLINQFRVHSSLFGALDTPGSTGWSAIVAGGPFGDEEVNQQPFVVYPLTLRATQGGAAMYTGG